MRGLSGCGVVGVGYWVWVIMGCLWWGWVVVEGCGGGVCGVWSGSVMGGGGWWGEQSSGGGLGGGVVDGDGIVCVEFVVSVMWSVRVVLVV